jgi:hypothetical protein
MFASPVNALKSKAQSGSGYQAAMKQAPVVYQLSR